MCWKNVLFLWTMILLLSCCCKRRKNCSGVENVFSSQESRYITFDSLRSYSGSERAAFISNTAQTDSLLVSVTQNRSNIRCEWSCCKICQEDRELYGGLGYRSEIVNASGASFSFGVDITKSKDGFTKNFNANSFSFNNFDSIRTNLTIHSKIYDTVYIKTFDTLRLDVYKIWYAPDHGLLKYQLKQNNIWELK